MPTIATTEAFIVDGVQTTALEQRLYDTAMFLGDGTANGVRGGIVRHGDSSLAVTVDGSDQVTIQAGACVIPAATGQGVWRGALGAASAAVGISSRNSTNPRIDLVVAQATGTNITFKTIDGTPSASPSAPALPAQHIELARLSVPAVAGGAVTVDSSYRTYAAAIGGTLYVETAARLPGSGNQKGQHAVALDTGLEHVWNGTAWVPDVQLGAWTAYTPTLTATTTNPTLGTGGSATARYTAVGKLITVHYRIIFGTGPGAGSGNYQIALPVAPSTAWANRVVGHGLCVRVAPSAAMPVTLQVVGTSSVVVMQFPASWPGGTLSTVTHVNIWPWAAGDEIHGVITYEAA